MKEKDQMNRVASNFITDKFWMSSCVVCAHLELSIRLCWRDRDVRRVRVVCAHQELSIRLCWPDGAVLNPQNGSNVPLSALNTLRVLSFDSSDSHLPSSHRSFYCSRCESGKRKRWKRRRGRRRRGTRRTKEIGVQRNTDRQQTEAD